MSHLLDPNIEGTIVDLVHNVATVSSRRIEMVGYNLERNDQTVSASSSVYLGGGLVAVFVYLTS